MDSTDTNKISGQFENREPETSGENELSYSDKMIGVFTEPVKTFTQTAKFPPKVSDWVIPIISFIVIAILSNFLLLQNAEIKIQFEKMINKRMEKMEAQMQEKVQSGKMTETDKEKALEQTRKGIEFMTGPFMRSITLVFYTFIGFFFMALLYFLLARFVFKGEGNYNSAMVARGLPVYILLVQTVVVAIISLLFKKLIVDSSLASFLDVERNTITGYLLSRIDPFAIWFYSLVGIGLAKMFKSDSITKYIIIVFAIWLLGDLLLLLLGIGFG